jgi:Polyketide cyclase / dehydrase and lipid transport
MRTHTASIQIDAAPAAVLDLVADLDQLPRWAVGFARAVEPDDEDDRRRVVLTGSGDRVSVAVRADRDAGVVDFDVAGVPAYTRAMAANGATLYAFTMLQPPEMPDAVFDAQIAALDHELVVLKSIVEVACPR